MVGVSGQASVQQRTDGDGTSQPRDEVKQYLSCRYISPAEACWRISEFPTNERFPPVIHLAVHLDGQDEVFFDEDISPKQLQNVLDRKDSTLTAFFKYNAEHPKARTVLYNDFPSRFTYK